MSTTRMRPACDRPGSNTSPGLRAAKVTVLVGLHRGALHRAGETVDPRRDVDRDHGPAPCAELVGEPGGVAFEGAAEAGAVHRVDREVGPAERARQTDAGRPRTRARPRARARPNVRARVAATRPSPPLLPLPHTITTRRPYHRRSVRRASHATARTGALHEDADRRAGGDRAAIGAPIASGVSDGLTSAPPTRDHDRHRGGVRVRERQLPVGARRASRRVRRRPVQRERRRAALVRAPPRRRGSRTRRDPRRAPSSPLPWPRTAPPGSSRDRADRTAYSRSSVREQAVGERGRRCSASRNRSTSTRSVPSPTILDGPIRASGRPARTRAR